MPIRMNRAAFAIAALSLGAALSGCDTFGAAKGAEMNRSLDSIRQPVVENQNYTLDLAAGPNGLPIPEQRRLAEWFDTMNIGYGDRIAIDDSMASIPVRADVGKIAARHSLLVSEGAPVTQGYVAPGKVRIVVTRSRASVPGCPDWTERRADYGVNTTAPGFGCAINGNLAAMIADPQQLLHGATGTGETVIMSSTKAIESYRERKPTGASGLPAVSTEAGK